ncbi:hypothetical protein Vadar_034627 [Vaccinium darrowii]|uniref:Uncharacterized protein n=1 Tax=Vaccinium darrowii TaxID=229202 RepID=A0ACB7X6X5_9ERIC|nr:hypothetical protein Vadar_034627 [Vaccinium darrowii]
MAELVATVQFPACCAVFATVGAVESRFKELTGKYIPLSVQEPINLIPNWSNVCRRQQPEEGTGFYQISVEEALYQFSEYGVCLESAMPFTGVREMHGAEEDTERMFIDGYNMLNPQNYAKEIHEALEHNVAVIGGFKVASEAIHQIKDMSIYDEIPKFNRALGGHGVLICGMGKEIGKDYYKIQNSWNENWGVKGFGNISQNLFNIMAVPGIPFFSTRRDSEANRLKARVDA